MKPTFSFTPVSFSSFVECILIKACMYYEFMYILEQFGLHEIKMAASEACHVRDMDCD